MSEGRERPRPALLTHLLRGAWFKQTRAEQAGYRSTANLFFGALLGANLGTLSGLPVADYVKVTGLLIGWVIALQLIVAARSRRYALTVASSYGVMLAYAWRADQLRPAAMSEADFAKLAATLAMWLVLVAIVEITPILEPDGDGHA